MRGGTEKYKKTGRITKNGKGTLIREGKKNN